MLLRCSLMLLVLAATADISASSSACQPPAEVARTIDVKDLLSLIPDIVGAHKGGLAGQPEPERTALVDLEGRLLDTLHLALGESRPKMLEIKDGQIVASGTDAQLQELAELIATLRQERSIQINIEARLLTLSEKGVQSLPEGLRGAVARASIGPQSLHDEDVALLMEKIRAGNDGVGGMLTAPNLTVFNQQKAFVVIKSNQSYNADLKRDDQGVWTPVVGSVWSGVEMNIQAAANADGSGLTASVALVLQSVLGFDDVPMEGTDLVKQVPRLERIEVDRIAVGAQPVLLGVRRLASLDAERAKEDRPLVLFIVHLKPIAKRPVADPATAPPRTR